MPKKPDTPNNKKDQEINLNDLVIKLTKDKGEFFWQDGDNTPVQIPQDFYKALSKYSKEQEKFDLDKEIIEIKEKLDELLGRRIDVEKGR